MNVIQPFPREQTLESGGNAKGVAIGIVTENKDASGQGRVKVRFPWYEDADSSYWARIATPMAGPDRGIYFIPEIDDEVLVAFERGDVRFPYILGSLWSGRDRAPEDNADGKNDIRLVKTRKGHMLIFNDGARGLIRIEFNDGKYLEITDDHIELKDVVGNRITMDKSGKVSLDAVQKFEVTAPQVDINASMSIKLKAGTLVTVEGALVKIN